MIDKTVDARGLNCPMPILRTKKALQEIPVGGKLEVLATDPGSMSDLEAFARQTGDELMSAEKTADHYRYIIRRLR
jgi:tRNA 2-thiouridine synthesizing protein A